MLKGFRTWVLAAFATLMLALLGGCGDTNNNTITNVTTAGLTAKGTVTGVLTDAVTNEPLVGVTVYLADKQAVTGAGGQFTINNVPAQTAFKNEPGLGPVSTDPYNVVIDMSSINNAIDAFNNNPANTVKKAKYPAFAYTTVNARYQIVNPNVNPGTFNNYSTGKLADGFVANIAPKVGKLDANIQIQVVDANLVPVSGATVRLFQDGSAAFDTTTNPPNNTSNNVQTNSSSGNFGHLIGSATSDASGLVTFTGLEATKSFAAYANKGNLQGVMMVLAPADNQTTVYLNQQDIMTNPAPPAAPSIGADGLNDALVMTSVDSIAPFVVSTTPATLADIAPGATSVVFTFSEPIKATGYALATTEAGAQSGGLWKDVFVNFDGPKAGNLAYTLTWNSDMTQLTVAFTTAPAGTYQVDITKALDGTGTGPAPARLIDASNNNFGAPFNNAKVLFSTSGGNTVAKPVLVRTNDTTIDWAPVTNAYKYRVYVEKVVGGVSEGSVNVGDTTDTHYALATVAGVFTFEGFTRDQIPVWYNVKVITMGTVNVESAGATSDPVKLNDTTAPRMTGVAAAPASSTFAALLAGSQAVPGAANAATTFTLSLAFNEEMLRASVQDPTKWTATRAGATLPGGAYTTGANDVDPVISNIVYTPVAGATPAFVTLTIKVTNNATGNATWDPRHVVFTFSGTDVNGNAINTAADQFDVAGGVF